MSQKKPCVLIIMDGYGIAPPADSNAVSLARKPNFDKYQVNFPTYTLLSSGESVGLSWGEIGNSEVGHLNLGIGKIFFQNLPRIDRAINDNSFFENETLLQTMEHAKKNQSRLHLCGLLSDGKVHSAISHVVALLEMAKKHKIKEVYLHCFLDGRDTIYNSAKDYLGQVQNAMEKINIGKIASLSGRFYAMDRDNHWERVEKTYEVMVQGESEESFENPIEALEASYAKKIYDEEFIPVVITEKGRPVGLVEDNDAVIFFNYRADRARQLTKAFVDESFDKFSRKKIINLVFATFTEYEKNLPVKIVFEKEVASGCLGKIISDVGLSQFHVAETEKYAHVTYFFNGGQELILRGEDREVIPSPRVSSYAMSPEMSAFEVTAKLNKTIIQEKHDFFVVNFANPDMVGHTGDIQASVKAVETVDRCLGEVVDLVLSKGGKCVITADHGNCEELRNLQTGEISKDHSTNPVPCIIIGEEFYGKTNPQSQLIGNDLSLLSPVGLLIDVPATILKLMEIEIPREMTGKPLI
jgi:2,3-bisphosphoglycerate-independent phosphoglycerate mutase